MKQLITIQAEDLEENDLIFEISTRVCRRVLELELNDLHQTVYVKYDEGTDYFDNNEDVIILIETADITVKGE